MERLVEPTLSPRSITLTLVVVRESCGAYLPRTKKT
jgi:hypothetical protein